MKGRGEVPGRNLPKGVCYFLDIIRIECRFEELLNRVTCRVRIHSKKLCIISTRLRRISRSSVMGSAIAASQARWGGIPRSIN